jgi:hypothetical protein
MTMFGGTRLSRAASRSNDWSILYDSPRANPNSLERVVVSTVVTVAKPSSIDTLFWPQSTQPRNTGNVAGYSGGAATIEEIRPGEVVGFEPEEKHWHGASGDLPADTTPSAEFSLK